MSDRRILVIINLKGEHWYDQWMFRVTGSWYKNWLLLNHKFFPSVFLFFPTECKGVRFHISLNITVSSMFCLLFLGSIKRPEAVFSYFIFFFFETICESFINKVQKLKLAYSSVVKINYLVTRFNQISSRTCLTLTIKTPEWCAWTKITSSKSTIETLEKGLKCVQS